MVCLLPQGSFEELSCLTGFLSLQTPLSWQELEGERAISCTHKRSASWGSTDHRKEVTAPFDAPARVAASCLPLAPSAPKWTHVFSLTRLDLAFS